MSSEPLTGGGNEENLLAGADRGAMEGGSNETDWKTPMLEQMEPLGGSGASPGGVGGSGFGRERVDSHAGQYGSIESTCRRLVVTSSVLVVFAPTACLMFVQIAAGILGLLTGLFGFAAAHKRSVRLAYRAMVFSLLGMVAAFCCGIAGAVMAQRHCWDAKASDRTVRRYSHSAALCVDGGIATGSLFFLFVAMALAYYHAYQLKENLEAVPEIRRAPDQQTAFQQYGLIKLCIITIVIAVCSFISYITVAGGIISLVVAYFSYYASKHLHDRALAHTWKAAGLACLLDAGLLFLNVEQSNSACHKCYVAVCGPCAVFAMGSAGIAGNLVAMFLHALLLRRLRKHLNPKTKPGGEQEVYEGIPDRSEESWQLVLSFVLDVEEANMVPPDRAHFLVKESMNKNIAVLEAVDESMQTSDDKYQQMQHFCILVGRIQQATSEEKGNADKGLSRPSNDERKTDV